jgi:hypothetical protein
MLDPISQKSRFLSPELHKKLDNLPRMSSLGKAGKIPTNPRVDTNP